jgi:S-adenosylmethionine-diacylglycerol 3-amino-3-carboxypropyl transferase
LSDRLDERLFRTLYASSLVYNTCWEDPVVDRQAFNLTPEDVLLVITSAGCNVLDYARSWRRSVFTPSMPWRLATVAVAALVRS